MVGLVRAVDARGDLVEVGPEDAEPRVVEEVEVPLGLPPERRRGDVVPPGGPEGDFPRFQCLPEARDHCRCKIGRLAARAKGQAGLYPMQPWPLTGRGCGATRRPGPRRTAMSLANGRPYLAIPGPSVIPTGCCARCTGRRPTSIEGPLIEMVAGAVARPRARGADHGPCGDVHRQRPRGLGGGECQPLLARGQGAGAGGRAVRHGWANRPARWGSRSRCWTSAGLARRHGPGREPRCGPIPGTGSRRC